MLKYVVVVLLLAGQPAQGEGWVKVANFYSPSSSLLDIFSTLKKTPSDLEIVAVDTAAAIVRLPLKDVPYYGVSKSWTKLNETLYFGRLSLFVVNYANTDVEHIILQFKGNMTIGPQDRSVMTLVNDKSGLSGHVCNTGKRPSKSRTIVNICLHGVEETGNVDTRLIWVRVQQTNCPDCTEYDIRAHRKKNSLEFTLPEQKKMEWNLTIEYGRNKRPTTLCYIMREFAPGTLNMVVMKQNLTVGTMYECVVFTEVFSDPFGLWKPIIAGLIVVVIVVLAALLVYKKCNKTCLRELMPTPDQDRSSAPYRSFNSSNHTETPPPPHSNKTDNRYIKMKTVSSNGTSGTSTEYRQGHKGAESIQSEPHYERI